MQTLYDHASNFLAIPPPSVNASCGSLIEKCVDLMSAQTKDSRADVPQLWILPSLRMIQQVRHHWQKQGHCGIIPPMVTYDHPLRYTVSARYAKMPISVAKALSWTIAFLDQHQENAGRKALLSGLAYDMIHVWEHAEERLWFQWEASLPPVDSLLSAHNHPSPPTLPPWPMDESLPYTTMCTLQLVQQWWSFWPLWLEQHNYCSQSAASGMGRQVLARDIAVGKSVTMVLDKRSALPWGWIKQWCHWPHVTCVTDQSPHDITQQRAPSQCLQTSTPISQVDPSSAGTSWNGILTSRPSSSWTETETPTPTSISTSDPLSFFQDGSPFEPSETSPTTRSLSANTVWEQSRLLAFLLHHLLSSCPDQTIGLIHQDPQGLAMTSSVLQAYDLHISLPQHPLIASLFMALWRAVMWHHKPVEDGGAWLWDILCHPLVLKQYPAVGSMERWIRHYAVWPTLAHTHNIGNDKAPRPLWMRRIEEIMGYLWSLYQPLGILSDQPLCLSLWLETHIQGVERLVPSELWDHTEWLNLLMHELQSPHHPVMTAEQYESWMTTWFSTIYHQPTKGSSRIIVGSCEELSSLGLKTIIMGMADKKKPYPWLPSWCLDRLGINLDSLQSVPLVAEGGIVWQVVLDHHPETTQSNHPFCDKGPGTLGSLNAQAEAIFQTPVADTKPFHCFKRSDPNKQTPYAPSIKSVTISDIQRWRQDHERFYRESLLKIKSPEVTHQQVWGMAVHTIMEHLVRSCPVTDVYSVAQLAQTMKELASVYLPPMVWWQKPLLSDMWDQAAAMEHVMRQGVIAVLTETSGAFDIHAPSGDTCRLWGRADRLNIKEDGSIDIIDYKTGAVPTFVAMERFESVQLPLEAWLVTKGGMARHENGTTRLVSGMAWWSFHWRKGCSIKRYPRCASSLVYRYDQILPVWAQQLITGSYMTTPHASETTAPPATSLSSGHNDSTHKPASV